MDDRFRERLFGAVGTAMILGAIGAGLVLGLGVDVTRLAEVPTRLVTLALPPPPPPPRIEPQRRSPAARAPAPPAAKARPTPVAPPPPIVRLSPPPPIAVAAVPDLGAAARAGAARAGDGQGAGGHGRGTGGGGDGDGGTPPEQVRGTLDYADMPAELRAAGTGATVGVRYAVEVDGRVADCAVARSSGMADLDAITCRLIERRFRFRPALDEDGRPVRAVVTERHVWSVEHDRGGDR